MLCFSYFPFLFIPAGPRGTPPSAPDGDSGGGSSFFGRSFSRDKSALASVTFGLKLVKQAPLAVEGAAATEDDGKGILTIDIEVGLLKVFVKPTDYVDP